MDIFLEKIKQARKMLKLSQAQLAEAVQIAQKDVSNIENGSRQFIPIQYISFLSQNGIDLGKLYDPECKNLEFVKKPISEIENVELIHRGNHRGISKSKLLPLQNTRNFTEVVMMNIEAAASISGTILGDYPEEVATIQLPTSMIGKSGKFLGFKVRNESMHPTLYDGDWVIGRHIDTSEWQMIKNERLYVISTKDDGVKIKRVRNRLKEAGFLRCRSDNKFYTSFNIEQTEISAIFEVKCRISFNFPNEPAAMQEQIKRLEDRLDDLDSGKRPGK